MKWRLIVSVSVALIAAATAGAGLFALFSDTATSTNNLFGLASVDLKINNLETIGAFIGATNMRPGDCTSGSVSLKNDGLLTGAAVDLDIGIDDSPGGQGYGLNGDLARYLQIGGGGYGSDMMYGSTVITIPDSNGNGFTDLQDWNEDNAATRDLPDPGPSGTSFSLTVCVHNSVPNDLAGQNVQIDFKFFLAQIAAGDLT